MRVRRTSPALATGAITVALLGGLLVGPAQAVPLPTVDSITSAAEPTPVRSLVDPRADATKVTFLVGLKRKGSELDAAASAVAQPGELAYRDFPTLAKASSTFGANAKTIKKARNAAKRAGLSIQIDPSGLLARLTGTTATWNKVFGLKMAVTEPTAASPYRVYAMVDGQKWPSIPADFRSSTVEWAPMYAEYVAEADTAGIDQAEVSGLEALLAAKGSPMAWPKNTGTLPAGTCDAEALTGKKVFAPGQLRTAYGTDALAKKGMQGKGAKITVVSLGGGFEESDLEAAAECFGHSQPRIDVALGTGVKTPFVNASVETHLDLITVSSVMPKAESIRLLEIVDPLIGFTDAFSRMLTDGDSAPDVVSISYGVCEAEFADDLGPMLSLNDDLLRMAALTGISVLVASGDYGSSMCGAEYAAETADPTVWYPASSPWITGVGGTRLTLRPNNTRKSEVVWNDLPHVGDETPAPAGSGGTSAVFPRPAYQAGATSVGPRMVPDVAMLGAIRPGWPIVYGGEVFTVGGTSGATPFLAANLALMAGKEKSRGYPRLGFVNPWFYEVASTPKNPFFDVTTGMNSVQLVGCCSAYAGYDMASGLGVPAADLLYASLPRPAG